MKKTARSANRKGKARLTPRRSSRAQGMGVKRHGLAARLTEDEADLIVSVRRMSQRNISFEEVAAQLGYKLDR
jgi:hypothetical protein